MLDAESLAAAEQKGTLKLTGNWTLGQIFGHLATWIGYAYDGVPFKTPLIIKLLFKVMRMKKRFIYGKMPAGVKIPRLAGGTLGQEMISTQEGLEKLRSVVARLKSQAPTLPHPIFGPLTHAEWQGTHLRHAELHLGFASVNA